MLLKTKNNKKDQIKIPTNYLKYKYTAIYTSEPTLTRYWDPFFRLASKSHVLSSISVP